MSRREAINMVEKRCQEEGNDEWILQFVRKHHLRPSELRIAIQYAARYGNLSTLKVLHEDLNVPFGPWSSIVLRQLSNMGFKDVAKYIRLNI